MSAVQECKSSCGHICHSQVRNAPIVVARRGAHSGRLRRRRQIRRGQSRYHPGTRGNMLIHKCSQSLRAPRVGGLHMGCQYRAFENYYAIKCPGISLV
eukprot:2933595-Amphidinium_carterae.1